MQQSDVKVPTEVRKLARMMSCPECHGAGGRIFDGKFRTCSFCGGDKIVSRSVMRQVARQHGYDMDTYLNKTYGRVGGL